MQKVKRRIFSGVVCEQEVFCISDRIKDIKQASPRLRFKNEEEREKHREGISRRKHARLINENFSPASLYCTLTLDDAHEVHTFTEAKKIRAPLHPQIEIRLPRRRDLCISRSWEKHTPHSYAYAGRRSAAGSHPTKMGTGQHPADRPPAGA